MNSIQYKTKETKETKKKTLYFSPLPHTFSAAKHRNKYKIKTQLRGSTLFKPISI